MSVTTASGPSAARSRLVSLARTARPAFAVLWAVGALMRPILPPWLRPGNLRAAVRTSLTRRLAAAYWLLVAVSLAPLMLLQGNGWRLLPALVAIAAIGAGILRNNPSRRWPWLLIAAAVAAWTAGDLLYAALIGDGRAAKASLNALTGLGMLYLLGFVTLAAALLRLRRSYGNGLAPAGLLDTITATLVLLLLVWVLVVSPGRPGPSSLIDPTLVAYPLGDALIAATAVRLAIVGPLHPPVLAVIGAAASRLVADLARSLEGSGLTGSLSWVQTLCAGLSAAFLGWAALHPSMALLTQTQATRPSRLSLRRFWVVAVTALVAPVVLLVQTVTGGVRDGVVLALLGGTLTVVALARVAATGDSQSRSLVYRSRTDTLTGLANRALLMQRLVEGGRAPWSAVLLVDLDHFRQLNHDEGPSVGDEVLVTLAGRLRHLAGPDDLVARVGGDEFALVVGGRGRDIAALAQRVLGAATTPVLVDRRPLHVSACVGIAAVPDSPGAGTAGGEELLRQAGLALRAAKAAGPAQSSRFDSDRYTPMAERFRLRDSLHQAIDEGAFFLTYQPIVAIQTGATVGFEALVRWSHPTQGLILPSEFIEVAEETGLIDAIGDLVLRTALVEAAAWPEDKVYVSVNVSPRQLRSPGFAERVQEALTASGLAPHRLMIELTERVVTKGDDHAWVELATLRDMGVRLALDDFGTGFSSLSYLEQTPIGVIKMDKSFVDSLVRSDRQRRVVGGIIAMARDIGLLIVAEGIETGDERDLLAEMGCPYGQGYLYSTPMTGPEVVAWLRQPPAPIPAQRITSLSDDAQPASDAPPHADDAPPSAI